MNTDLRILAQQLGEVQGRLKAAEEALREQGQDIKAILKTLNQARGGWKTLLLVAGMSGACGALATKVSTIIGALPR